MLSLAKQPNCDVLPVCNISDNDFSLLQRKAIIFSVCMHQQESKQGDESINLQDSSVMNQNQQALFLNFARSKSADSFLGRLLPHPNQVPERSLVWEMGPPTLTNNIIINHRAAHQGVKQEKANDQQSGGLHIFKKMKKEKVRNKCDYDKNICGYITKKVIREFVSKNYENQVCELVKKYHSNYAECKGYYLRKVELVTGPSHLPDLFKASANEPENIASCKKVFKSFYRWFLKERYLRYLLVQGKMSNKHAYIQYKNNYLFHFVGDQQPQPDMAELEYRIRTRSRSAVKVENEGEN